MVSGCKYSWSFTLSPTVHLLLPNSTTGPWSSVVDLFSMGFNLFLILSHFFPPQMLYVSVSESLTFYATHASLSEFMFFPILLKQGIL